MKRSDLLLVILAVFFLFLLSCDREIECYYNLGGREYRTTPKGMMLSNKAFNAIRDDEYERALEYAVELVLLEPKNPLGYYFGGKGVDGGKGVKSSFDTYR
jgi:hypothetical protein